METINKVEHTPKSLADKMYKAISPTSTLKESAARCAAIAIDFAADENASLLKQRDELLEQNKKFQWISVKDRLPIIGESQCKEVLCVIYGSIRICDYITGDGQGSFYTSYKKHFDNVTNIVTHWMPLPELPS